MFIHTALQTLKKSIYIALLCLSCFAQVVVADSQPNIPACDYCTFADCVCAGVEPITSQSGHKFLNIAGNFVRQLNVDSYFIHGGYIYVNSRPIGYSKDEYELSKLIEEERYVDGKSYPSVVIPDTGIYTFNINGAIYEIHESNFDANNVVALSSGRLFQLSSGNVIYKGNLFRDFDYADTERLLSKLKPMDENMSYLEFRALNLDVTDLPSSSIRINDTFYFTLDLRNGSVAQPSDSIFTTFSVYRWNLREPNKIVLCKYGKTREADVDVSKFYDPERGWIVGQEPPLFPKYRDKNNNYYIRVTPDRGWLLSLADFNYNPPITVPRSYGEKSTIDSTRLAPLRFSYYNQFTYSDPALAIFHDDSRYPSKDILTQMYVESRLRSLLRSRQKYSYDYFFTKSLKDSLIQKNELFYNVYVNGVFSFLKEDFFNNVMPTKLKDLNGRLRPFTMKVGESWYVAIGSSLYGKKGAERFLRTVDGRYFKNAQGQFVEKQQAYKCFLADTSYNKEILEQLKLTAAEGEINYFLLIEKDAWNDDADYQTLWNGTNDFLGEVTLLDSNDEPVPCYVVARSTEFLRMLPQVTFETDNDLIDTLVANPDQFVIMGEQGEVIEPADPKTDLTELADNFRVAADENQPNEPESPLDIDLSAAETDTVNEQNVSAGEVLVIISTLHADWNSLDNNLFTLSISGGPDQVKVDVETSEFLTSNGGTAGERKLYLKPGVYNWEWKGDKTPQEAELLVYFEVKVIDVNEEKTVIYDYYNDPDYIPPATLETEYNKYDPHNVNKGEFIVTGPDNTCSSCSSGDCGTDGNIYADSVHFDLNLGMLAAEQSAGQLFLDLEEAEMLNEPCSLKHLKIKRPNFPEVSLAPVNDSVQDVLDANGYKHIKVSYSAGKLSSLSSPELNLNVVPLSEGYELRVFSKKDLSTPLKVWKISPVNNQDNSIEIASYIDKVNDNNSVTRTGPFYQHQFIYDEISVTGTESKQDKWTLTKPLVHEREELLMTKGTKIIDGKAFETIDEVRTYYNTNDNSFVSGTFETSIILGYSLAIAEQLYFDEDDYKLVVAEGSYNPTAEVARSQVSEYQYYLIPNQARYKKLRAASYPDQSWAIYDYDDKGRTKVEYSGYMNDEMPSLAQIVETFKLGDGKESMTFSFKNSDDYTLDLPADKYCLTQYDYEGAGMFSDQPSGVQKFAEGQPVYKTTTQIVPVDDISVSFEGTDAMAQAVWAEVTSTYLNPSDPASATISETRVYNAGKKLILSIDSSGHASYTTKDEVKTTSYSNLYAETTVDGDGVSNVSLVLVPGKSTKTETTVDQFGRTRNVTSFVYAKNSPDLDSNAAEFKKTDERTMTYDSRGRLFSTTFLDGYTETRDLTCCGEASTTDRAGSTTSYGYDDMKRRTETIQEGVADAHGYDGQYAVKTRTVYDAAGRVTHVYRNFARSAGVTSTFDETEEELISETVYYPDGRIWKSFDRNRQVTIYTYGFDESPPTETVAVKASDDEDATLLPGSSKTYYYRDGQVRLTEDLVSKQKTAYSYEYDGANLVTTTTTTVPNSDEALTQITVTDPAGRTVSTTSTGPNGQPQTTRYNYNPENHRLESISTTGNPTQIYVYDEFGQLEMTVSDDDNSYNENETFDLASVDRISHSASFALFFDNKLWNVQQQLLYPELNSNDRIVSSEIRSLIITEETYKEFPDLNLDLASAKLQAETHSYDVHRNISKSYTLVDKEKQLTYQISETAGVAGYHVSIAYNGKLVKTIDPTGRIITYKYDSRNRRKEVIDSAAEGKRVFAYYDNDQLKSETHSYDEVLETEEVIHVSLTTSYGYDELGRQDLITNPDNSTQRMAYDEQGRLYRVWGSATYPVEYGYDAWGNKDRMTTFTTGNFDTEHWPTVENGQTTTWLYNYGQLATKTDADGEEYTYTYYDNGRMHTRMASSTVQVSGNLERVTTTYEYNDLGYLTTVSYNDGTPTVSYSDFDRLGRPGLIIDAVGAHTFSYDPTTLALDSEAIGPVVDVNGNVTREALYQRNLRHTYETSTSATELKGRSNGYIYDYNPEYIYNTIRYEYDEYGRIKHAYDNDGVDFNYTYHPFGAVDEVTNAAAGITRDYTYHPARLLLTGVNNKKSAYSSSISNYVYNYDKRGRRSDVTMTGSAFDQDTHTVYTYNDRSEIDTVNRYNGTDNTTDPVQSYDFNFDNIGNRSGENQFPAENVTYQPKLNGSQKNNGLNQYGEISTVDTNNNTQIQNIIPGYNADGSITEYGDWDLTWNGENRLATATSTTTGKAYRFIYDYMGRLAKISEQPPSTTPQPTSYETIIPWEAELWAYWGLDSTYRGSFILRTTFDPATKKSTLEIEDVNNAYTNLSNDPMFSDSNISLAIYKSHYASFTSAEVHEVDTFQTIINEANYYNHYTVQIEVTPNPNGAGYFSPLEVTESSVWQKVGDNLNQEVVNVDTFFFYNGWNLIERWSNKVHDLYFWGLDVTGSLTAAGGVGALLQNKHIKMGDVTDQWGYTYYGELNKASYYYSYDGNGNVSEVIDESGNVAAHYEYSPFGKLTKETVNDSTLNNYGQPFKFSTKYQLNLDNGGDSGSENSALELYYYGYRYYSPELGRWISRDPIEEEGGLNLYNMVANNPVDKWDLLGQQASCKCEVKSFSLKIEPWDIDWADDPTGKNNMHLEVNFKLVLKDGTDKKDCLITQWKKGLVKRTSKTSDFSYWTADGVIGNRFWWDGEKWTTPGNWSWLGAGNTATFKDAPGISLDASEFPVYWGGVGGTGHFKFKTQVLDKATGDVVKELTWGMLIDYKKPGKGNGKHYFYY